MQAVCRGYWQNYQTDSEFVLEVTEIHEDVTLLRSSLWKQRIDKAGIHDGLFLIIRNVAIIALPLSKPVRRIRESEETRSFYCSHPPPSAL
jgi:hypothetical protein